MLQMRIAGTSRVLAEDQDEYHKLAIRDEMHNGVKYMTSLWEPTPKELADLMHGGCVLLHIIGEKVDGSGHPPVKITTQKLQR